MTDGLMPPPPGRNLQWELWVSEKVLALIDGQSSVVVGVTGESSMKLVTNNSDADVLTAASAGKPLMISVTNDINPDTNEAATGIYFWTGAKRIAMYYDSNLTT